MSVEYRGIVPYLFFDDAMAALAWYRRALAEDAKVDSTGSGFNSFALAHNVYSNSEVDEGFAQAISAGSNRKSRLIE